MHRNSLEVASVRQDDVRVKFETTFTKATEDANNIVAIEQLTNGHLITPLIHIVAATDRHPGGGMRQGVARLHRERYEAQRKSRPGGCRSRSRQAQRSRALFE